MADIIEIPFDEYSQDLYDNVLATMSSAGKALILGYFKKEKFDKKEIRSYWLTYHFLDYITLKRADSQDKFDQLLNNKSHESFIDIQKKPSGHSAFTETFSNDMFEMLAEFEKKPKLIAFIKFLEFCDRRNLLFYIAKPKRDKQGIRIDKKSFILEGPLKLKEETVVLKKYVKYYLYEHSRKGPSSAGNPSIEGNFVREIFDHNIAAYPYIGDCIEIARFSDQTIKARVETPYEEAKHVYTGIFDVPDSEVDETKEWENKECFESWTKRYSPDVREYIKDNIQDQSSPNSEERAKVGFVAYKHDDGAADSNATPLTIEPINHLVTAAFNRKIATERLKYNASSPAHELWYASFDQAVNKAVQFIEFPCPSQLFVELGVVTSDFYVPVSKKTTRTSVYALRNNGDQLKTCGFESGANWKKIVRETDEENIVELDMISEAINGLEREYNISKMKDWESKKKDIEVRVSSYVIQTFHLNTAILGYCKIPYTKDELETGIKGEICGGLDHSDLSFINISECRSYAGRFRDTTDWHGTALMRLDIIGQQLDG